METQNRAIRGDGARASEPRPMDPIPVPRDPMRSPAEDRSLGELFTELSDEVRSLVRQEIALAKVELKEKVTSSAVNVGLMVGGGLVAYTGAFALVAAVILLLGLIMPYWLSALIVGLAVVGLGYALVQKGQKGLAQTNFSLERTAQTLKEDQKWAKDEVNDMR